MMRILLIHQVFLSPSEAGGTRHYELARHCVSSGHQFTIVASDTSYLDGKPIGRGSKERIDGIDILRAHLPRWIHRSFVWRVLAFLWFMASSAGKAMEAGRVDVIMGTSPPLFQAVSACLVACVRRRPFLLEIRDLWPEFAIDMGILKSPLLIWLSRRVEAFLYRQAKHILVNSPAYRDYLLARGIDDARITVIPNGVDPDMFDPDHAGTAFRKQMGLEKQFVVTYAGAIGPANDIATLVKAAQLLRGHAGPHLLIVGGGKEAATIRRTIADYGLNNVTMLDPLPKARMKEVLGASDACVAILQNIPMFKTTYPNKVFDYMAAGRPIVLAIDGVIREVVEAAGAGIFARPGDESALAEAVLQLHRNPQEARRMGERARAYVVKHFDRRRHAAAFLRLLERVAEPHRRG